MQLFLHRIKPDVRIRLRTVALGVALNVVLTYIAMQLKLPIFLNAVGTIFLAAVGGALPGMIAGIISNLICCLFQDVAMYFGIINAIIAIFTSQFVKRYSYHNAKTTILFILESGFVCGLGSSFIQWFLFNGPQLESIGNNAYAIAVATGIPIFISFLFVNILANCADMAISLFIAIIFFFIIPDKVLKQIKDATWRQRPLTDEEVKEMMLMGKGNKNSVRTRLALVILGVSFTVIFIMGWIELSLYLDVDVSEKEQAVTNASQFAASVIDPEKIEDYLILGEGAEGYKETEEMLYKIRNSAVGVGYLYVVRFNEDSCTYIFDLDVQDNPDSGYYEDEKGHDLGDVVRLKDYYRKYIDDLIAGKEIPIIESNEGGEWLLTAYTPVYDSKGNCVCYCGADATLNYITRYIRRFLIRILLIMSGIIATVLAYALWNTGAYIAYPINTIAKGVESFIKAGNDQKELDIAIKQLRNYDIRTGDEVEKLYNFICDMAVSQAEQLRSIRKYSESTVKMQDGLIITMADLVENRNTELVPHTRMTTACVKLIVEGLKEKGYYAGKITPNFIADVVRSAPLYDIGKINVSDSILNKKGNLSEEEYELYKKHTTAGKAIIENAISIVEGEEYLKEARNMAAYHHEWWDGTGYPEGLHGEVIPLSARIMAVVDEFDVLTSNRANKKAYSFDEAVEKIKALSGKRFDPKCIEVFLELLPEIKVVYSKYSKIM